MTQSNTTIKKLMLIIIGIIIIVALGIMYHQKFNKTTPLPKPVSIDTRNQPTTGNPNAKIHLIAFEDLKCANCARFNNTLFPYIEKTYIDTGKAKYTMINLAFLQGSLPAANAARCIYQQNKKLFFSFVKYVYTHQPPENENWATIPRLLDFANNISGINTNKLSNCLINNNYNQFFQNNMKLAAKLMKDNVATPSLYINGVLVRPLTKKRFKAVIRSMEKQ